MYFITNQNVGILLLFVVSHVVVKMVESCAANTVSHFRSPKTGEEESKLLEGSIPKSTAYNTKFAIKIFHHWQINRKVKVPVLDADGTFKDYGVLSKVQSLSTDLANMDPNALNYWLSKVVQEVANSQGKVYPARNLNGIVCGKDEEKFWSAGLFGSGTAKQLLDTIYFYNGKMFGLYGGEHRKICVNNFSIEPNVINNVCKTFHGGITDLKYKPGKVRHICHERGQEHD